MNFSIREQKPDMPLLYLIWTELEVYISYYTPEKLHQLLRVSAFVCTNRERETDREIQRERERVKELL